MNDASSTRPLPRPMTTEARESRPKHRLPTDRSTESSHQPADDTIERVNENERNSWGHALISSAEDGTILDAWFPAPRLGAPPADSPAPDDLTSQTGSDPRRRVIISTRLVTADLDAPITSTPDAYLRLHLLSHLIARPNTLCLDGLFDHMPSVVFTNAGPLLAADFDSLLPSLRREGIQAYAVDRFPRLLDYVLPDRVRIADAARVRLGAHLAPGTVVMHEGFVNYNAGTLGESMIEGRVSQGVIVAAGSDIGGGASILGTLSGGGTRRVAIGARALLGANSGTGISLGDDSIVEAGLYLTAGTKVTLQEETTAAVVRASDLSGVPNLLFRRNSVTGAVEALPRSGDGISLNPTLHG